jgi:O-antigen/teichoic acid export membrane protein
LVIICIGKSFHAILGLTGMLFNMTGNEKFTAISSGIGTGCNFVLNLILIPSMGMAGAAIATVIGGLITVGFLFINCKRIVGIRPLAF